MPNPLQICNYFHWVFKLSSINKMRSAILQMRHFNNYLKRLKIKCTKCKTKFLILISSLISEDGINLRWSTLRSVINFYFLPSCLHLTQGNIKVKYIRYTDITTDQLHTKELNVI